MLHKKGENDMDNWTYNTITGFSKELAEKYIDKIGNFDFNKLIPIPESLKIYCDVQSDKKIYIYLSEKLSKPISEVKESKYSKLITNAFNKDWISAIKEYIDNDIKKGILTENKIDEDYEKGKIYVNNYEKYGAITYIDWCRNNWGTRNNAYDTYYDELSETLSFSTIWNAPVTILKKLAEDNPNVKLDFYAENEDGEYLKATLVDGKYIEIEKGDVDYILE
jgi:hypothetical protein